jgi:transcriptional regulator with XRE-family HTH domain
MRAKSEKRLLAEKLRREQGLSYNEIAALTGTSKSTLSNWLRDVPLTAEQEARLQERSRANRASFAARALPINRERYRRAREQAYRSGVEVATRLPDDPSVEELALAMLYLGDGSKTGGAVRMGSVNPDILAYFVWALKHLYNVDECRLSCRLHLVEAAREREDQLIQWWAVRLSLPQGRFRPATFDRRSQTTEVTDDYHGVCVVHYSDIYLQQRILGLAKTYIHSRTTSKAQEK